MTYKGKVDWWMGLLVVAGIALPALSAIRTHRNWMVIPPAAIALFILICAWPQKYETAGDALRIRAGLMTRTIPWSAIVSATFPSDSQRSVSLVLSMDRILIQYSGGEIMIAPDDQTRFLEDVASHCPQLSRRGSDLVIALN